MTTVTITDGSRSITVSPHGTNVYVGTVMDPPVFYLGHSIEVGSGGLNAFQVAYMAGDGTALPASSANTTHAGRVLGISETTQAAGTDAVIQISGEIENPAWTLETGKAYFLASGGEITLTPPVAGFAQRIGVAKTEHILVINLGEPILR